MGLKILSPDIQYVERTNKRKASKRAKVRDKERKRIKRHDKRIMAKKERFKNLKSLTKQIDNFDKMQEYLDADARQRSRDVAELEHYLAGGQAPEDMIGQEPGDPGISPAAPEYRLNRKKGGKVKKKAKAKSKAFNGNDFVRQVNNYKEM